MQPNYRNVFISGNKIAYAHADTDNGFSHNGRGIFDEKNPEAKKFFPRFKAEMENAMRARGIRQFSLLQPDLCAAFFTDDERGVLGFFFDGAEQFVCPYENIVDVFISDDGHMAPRRGGQYYVPASHFTFTVSFFIKTGTVASYSLVLDCGRSYDWIGTRKKEGRSHWLEESIDKATRANLQQIRAQILSLRALGTQISAGMISKPEIDLAELDRLATGSNERYEKNAAEVAAVQKAAKKKAVRRRVLAWVLGIGVPVCAIVVTMLILIYLVW